MCRPAGCRAIAGTCAAEEKATWCFGEVDLVLQAEFPLVLLRQGETGTSEAGGYIFTVERA